MSRAYYSWAKFIMKVNILPARDFLLTSVHIENEVLRSWLEALCWWLIYWENLRPYPRTTETEFAFLTNPPGDVPTQKFEKHWTPCLFCPVCPALRGPWQCLVSTSCPVGEGNGTPLQCSHLESPRDGGAWWAAIYGVAQSQTRLKRLSSSSSSSCPVNTSWLAIIWTVIYSEISC